MASVIDAGNVSIQYWWEDFDKRIRKISPNTKYLQILLCLSGIQLETPH
jgi:hypothetical protein